MAWLPWAGGSRYYLFTNSPFNCADIHEVVFFTGRERKLGGRDSEGNRYEDNEKEELAGLEPL